MPKANKIFDSGFFKGVIQNITVVAILGLVGYIGYLVSFISDQDKTNIELRVAINKLTNILSIQKSIIERHDKQILIDNIQDSILQKQIDKHDQDLRELFHLNRRSAQVRDTMTISTEALLYWQNVFIEQAEDLLTKN